MDTKAKQIIKTLKTAGFAAYLVGGAVRDPLLGKEPREWDIATSAQPGEVTKLFPRVIPTGIDYGTVTVLLDNVPYEVTTFRADEKYVDGRRPANVKFTGDIHQDLARRDFTINALALDPETGRIIDDFGGRDDLKKKLIKTVGNPLERFSEDGLRPLRACRLAAQLNFQVEPATLEAIGKTLSVFQKVAAERVHDELIKMLSADQPSLGLELMRQTGLLNIILPELAACFGVAQPPEFHPHDVYWHSLHSCDAAPKDNPLVRLAALFHDLGKPGCKVAYTFYGHDQAGASIAEAAMKRLKFSAGDTDKVVNLVANHMFDYSSEWGDAAVRRFIRRIGGVENAADLFALRRADARAMKSTVGSDYLLELQKRIDKIVAEENALHLCDLKVNGLDVMAALKIKPGPKVGEILDALLEKVLDNPELNERATLLALIKAHA